MIPDTPEEKKEKEEAKAFITPEEYKKMNPYDGLIHDKNDPKGTSASFPGTGEPGQKVGGVNYSNSYTLSHKVTNIKSKGHRDSAGTTFENTANRIETTPESNVNDFIGSGNEMAGFSKVF